MKGVGHVELSIDTCPPLDKLQTLTQRAHQTNLFQHGGPQFIEHQTHLFHCLLCSLAEQGQVFLDAFDLTQRSQPSPSFGEKAQAIDRLSHGVVQFTRKAFPLFQLGCFLGAKLQPRAGYRQHNLIAEGGSQFGSLFGHLHRCAQEIDNGARTVPFEVNGHHPMGTNVGGPTFHPVEILQSHCCTLLDCLVQRPSELDQQRCLG